MTNSNKILVVDDEATVTTTVAAYLQQEGFEVVTAANGPAALKMARTYRPDLIVLDIMLPDMDGFEVLQRVRRESEVYVLMLTAKAQEVDKVLGLTVGADAYMTKPFSPRELVAQVKAILRRGRGSLPQQETLEFSQICIKPQERRVWKRECELSLTAIEFDLFLALARHHGRVLSRDQLIVYVWGNDFFGDEHVVDVHMGHVRKKIDGADGNPSLITTVRGIGYRFEDTPL